MYQKVILRPNIDKIFCSKLKNNKKKNKLGSLIIIILKKN